MKVIKLRNPEFLNGAQTITSFNKFLAKYSDHPKLKSNRDRLEQIEVALSVITDASDEFVH